MGGSERPPGGGLVIVGNERALWGAGQDLVPFGLAPGRGRFGKLVRLGVAESRDICKRVCGGALFLRVIHVGLALGRDLVLVDLRARASGVDALMTDDDRSVGERVEPAPVLLAKGRGLVVVDAALDECVLDGARAAQRGDCVRVGGALRRFADDLQRVAVVGVLPVRAGGALRPGRPGGADGPRETRGALWARFSGLALVALGPGRARLPLRPLWALRPRGPAVRRAGSPEARIAGSSTAGVATSGSGSKVPGLVAALVRTWLVARG